MRALYIPFKGLYRALIPSFPSKNQGGVLRTGPAPSASQSYYILPEKGNSGILIFDLSGALAQIVGIPKPYPEAPTAQMIKDCLQRAALAP